MNIKKSMNIFIVEDNKVFILALKADIEAMFSSIPIKIHCFETGETCMRSFSAIKPEVVILDYNLNSKYSDAMNGIQILDWIKKKNVETNVVILSSDDSIEVALKSFKHGASDYVVKTETKFRKINYSLLNIFRMIEAKQESKRYKNLAVGLSLLIAFVIGGVLAVHILDPTLLK